MLHTLQNAVLKIQVKLSHKSAIIMTLFMFDKGDNNLTMGKPKSSGAKFRKPTIKVAKIPKPKAVRKVPAKIPKPKIYRPQVHQTIKQTITTTLHKRIA